MAHVYAYSDLEEPDADGKPWCDIIFDLTDHSIQGRKKLFGRDERAFVGTMRASTERGDIGFQVTVPLDGWDRQDAGGVFVWWGRIVIQSIGPETDRLLSEYENWFDMPASGVTATPGFECLAVVIEDIDPKDIEKKPFNTKLFLDPEGDMPKLDEYGELFLNLDVPNRQGHLREKDPEYRGALVGWLAGRFPTGMTQ